MPLIPKNSSDTALLNIQNLSVSFKTAEGLVRAVNNISLAIYAGEILAVVGESGSGKSQMAFAIMGLLARNGKSEGSVMLNNREILGLPESQLARIRATQIAMIFQNPMTSLNPYLRISVQMMEGIRLHQKVSKQEALKACIDMLEAVHIPDAQKRINMYPHQFSGGMRQRIMIAMSLLCRPRLLIADEPTTALDVTVQAQIVELLKTVRIKFDTSIMLITHDLGLVAGISEQIMVMYDGQIMEHGPTEAVFATPFHPYTRALLETVPRLDRDEDVLRVIAGEPPGIHGYKPGCPFYDRCPSRLSNCARQRPVLRSINNRSYACHLEINV